MPQLICFPNALGCAKPEMASVLALQSRHAFSDDLRDFLLTQNGLNLDGALADASRTHWPEAPDADAEGCAELRYLFALEAPHDWQDLQTQIQHLALFAGVFLPIGVGAGCGREGDYVGAGA